MVKQWNHVNGWKSKWVKNFHVKMVKKIVDAMVLWWSGGKNMLKISSWWNVRFYLPPECPFTLFSVWINWVRVRLTSSTYLLFSIFTSFCCHFLQVQVNLWLGVWILLQYCLPHKIHVCLSSWYFLLFIQLQFFCCPKLHIIQWLCLHLHHCVLLFLTLRLWLPLPLPSHLTIHQC